MDFWRVRVECSTSNKRLDFGDNQDPGIFKVIFTIVR